MKMQFPLWPCYVLLLVVLALRPSPAQPNPAAEKLATALVTAPSEAERAALWAANASALTPAVAQALLALGRQVVKQQEYSQALLCFQLAERVAELHHDRKTMGQALNNQGVVRRDLGDVEGALIAYQKSLALKDATDKVGRANSLNNLGTLSLDQGEFEQALRYFREVLELRQELGDKDAQSRVLNNLGGLYFQQGQYRLALGAYQQCLQLRDPSDHEGGAGTLNNIGNIYRHQGNYSVALDYLQRALAEAEAAQSPALQAMALNGSGAAYWWQEKYDQAEACFQKSLTLQSVESYAGRAATLLNLGAVYQARRDYARAQEVYQKSLELRERLNIPWLVAESCINLSGVIYRQGRASEALPVAERALQLARKGNHPDMLWHAQSNLGQIYRALHRPAEARAALEAAIQTIEALRETVSGDNAQQELFFENKVGPYHQLVELLLSQQQLSTALTFAERAKARVLLDVLRNGRTNIANAMTAAEQEQEAVLQRELVALNTQLQKATLRQPADPARLATLRDRLEQVRLRQAAFQTALYAAHPELLVQRGQTPSFDLPAVAQALLTPQTALLEYVVADDKTFLFVLTKDATKTAGSELRAYELPLGYDEINQQVATFRQQIASHDLTFAPLATRLYEQLLKPAAAQLKGQTHLILVRDAGLWELPFQALKNDAGHYLLADFAVSYAPSLTALAEMTKVQQARQKATTAPTVLAIGNPTLGGAKQETDQLKAGFASLPSSATEVQQLAKLYGTAQSKIYIGPDAREERVKAEAGAASILHLATHGILNDANPLYSQIVLAPPDAQSKEDGLLEAWEVMQLHLRAQVVVLSACETGRGRIGAGEGVIGLTWAFFVAGAPTTIVSQWKVDAASTSILMQDFHRRLQARTGIAKAEALRVASLKLMQNPKYRHPFFWASFSLLGEGQ